VRLTLRYPRFLNSIRFRTSASLKPISRELNGVRDSRHPTSRRIAASRSLSLYLSFPSGPGKSPDHNSSLAANDVPSLYAEICRSG
jgi:hypothetical protein